MIKQLNMDLEDVLMKGELFIQVFHIFSVSSEEYKIVFAVRGWGGGWCCWEKKSKTGWFIQLSATDLLVFHSESVSPTKTCPVLCVWACTAHVLHLGRAELLPVQDYSSGNRLSHATEEQKEKHTGSRGGWMEIVLLRWVMLTKKNIIITLIVDFCQLYICILVNDDP